jgi:hypothetical protein
VCRHTLRAQGLHEPAAHVQYDFDHRATQTRCRHSVLIQMDDANTRPISPTLHCAHGCVQLRSDSELPRANRVYDAEAEGGCSKHWRRGESCVGSNSKRYDQTSPPTTLPHLPLRRRCASGWPLSWLRQLGVLRANERADKESGLYNASYYGTCLKAEVGGYSDHSAILASLAPLASSAQSGENATAPTEPVWYLREASGVRFL